MRITKRDLKILHLLEKNSGLSVKNISASTGVPISTVFRKKKRFEEEGIVKRYRAVLAPERIGEPFVVVFYINTSEDGFGRSVPDELKKIHDFKEIISVQGNWNLLVFARTKTLKELRDLNDRIKELKGVQDVKSELILSREYL